MPIKRFQITPLPTASQAQAASPEACSQSSPQSSPQGFSQKTPPHVLAARLRLEAVVLEHDIEPDVTADSLHFPHPEIPFTLRFADRQGDIAVHLQLVFRAGCNPDLLSRIFAQAAKAAFSLACVETADGSVVLHSEKIVSRDFALSEIFRWWRKFHEMVHLDGSGEDNKQQG